MKIAGISSNSAKMSFGQLLEPLKDSYTPNQIQIATAIKDLSTLPCPNDMKGRNYVDFFEQEYKMNLYLEPLKETNSISLYSQNEFGEMDIIKHYPKGIKPKEHDFISHINYIDGKARDAIEKLITIILFAVITFAAIFSANKTGTINKTDKVIKKELIQKSPNKANFVPAQFVKKSAK